MVNDVYNMANYTIKMTNKLIYIFNHLSIKPRIKINPNI